MGPLTGEANPVGATVAQGQATITSHGPQLTIQTSDHAFINWQSFNISLGETTTFQQPSSSSLVWNQIQDANPSQILGNIEANGYVVLQNAAGFFIGGQASISTHGFLMTTAPLRTPDINGDGAWQFSAPPPTASIVNYGQIKTDQGGSLYLIANTIENHGTLSSQAGSIGLYAGKDVLVTDRPDGRGLSARVTLPAGSIDNSGRIVADAGSIAMHAQVVNQGGLVQANSVREENGSIELVASDSVHLGASSEISATGDPQGIGPGGSISIQSGGGFTDDTGSRLDVSGGNIGGNGGEVHISAQNVASLNSTISGRAAAPYAGGRLLLDPKNIVLANTGDSAPGSGVVNPGDPPSAGSPDTLNLSLNSFNNLISQSGLSQITLKATDLIELKSIWSLPNSSDTSAKLSLISGNNIILDPGSAISAGNNWSVELSAGTPASVPLPSGARSYGVYLDGDAYVQTRNGDISVWAANEVLIASASSAIAGNNGIRTIGGGNVSVTAQDGSVNCGANANGYIYLNAAPYHNVSTSVGGISTAAGGDVFISAGGDVISLNPGGATVGADAGTGAFGSQSGNVTITAGGSVYGHYVLGNGVGTITAGANVGATTGARSFALSLTKGSWTVNALEGTIFMQEVRNPNGVFNNTRAPFGSSASVAHLFDYDPEASVRLNANAVDFTDVNPPRLSGFPVPIVFPPILDVSAGSGGVILQDNVTLFPSLHQDLRINTTDGGNLSSSPNTPGTVPELLMSDSAFRQWIGGRGYFTDADLGKPGSVEPTASGPAKLNISGSMLNLNLITTKETEITVGGDMIGCSYSGQNLHSGGITSISVTGQIFNRSPYSFVYGVSIPNLPTDALPTGMGNSWDNIFALALNPAQIATLKVPTDIPPSEWLNYALQSTSLFGVSYLNGRYLGNNPGFVFNPSTGRLGFNGQMSQATLSALTRSPTFTVLELANGVPVTYTDSAGVTHFKTTTVAWVDSPDLTTLYQKSLGAPSPTTGQLGYRLGGAGEFDINAGSISLGNSYGILSCGVIDPQGGYDRFRNLASLNLAGATLNVTVGGNLDMLTSTIAAIGEGDVNVTSTGGSLDLGSPELFSVRRQIGFGIFTSGGGDVNVVASGDVDINGSRIAVFNGGNLLVKSLFGNVDAGSGGASFNGVGVSYVDPVTGGAGYYAENVFGSGILANTLVNPSQVPGAATQPGNITVETPRGNILANQGGILQEALNGNISAGPTVTLVAGTPAVGNPGDPDYQPGFAGNIDLGNSGVIGGTVNASANGNITGLVISRENSNINASQSFSGTVLSGGSASLSAGGTVSGTVIGVTGVSASGGGGISASLVSQNVSANGAAAGSTLGTVATATSASQAAAQQSSSTTTEKVALAKSTDDDDKKRKDKKKPTLTKRVGRVQVILPNRK